MSKDTQQTVLVTGGSGFVGGMVCRLLVQAGHNVINIDRTKKVIEGVTQYPFDIDNNQLKGVIALTKPDAVIHFAADHEVGRSVLEPHVFYKNNVANTIDLLNACIGTGVKNFIFSSSSSVYGDTLVFPTTEDLPMAPVSPYGRTKAMIETLLKDYASAYDFNFTSLRYFNAAGADPEGTHGYIQDPASHLIPIICRKALDKEVLVINGNDYDTVDGTCQRDYTHVFDIATAHLSAMNYLFDGGKSTSFNIGAGDSQSILQVVSAFEMANDLTISYEFGNRREGDPAITYADITKAKELLGWEPVYTINDICKHAFEWEKSQRK